MGYAAVPEAVQIQFQRFQLYDMSVRDIADLNCGEVGVSRTGAQAGKFREADIDHIIPVRAGIGPV